jgi:hypothetical protein
MERAVVVAVGFSFGIRSLGGRRRKLFNTRDAAIYCAVTRSCGLLALIDNDIEGLTRHFTSKYSLSATTELASFPRTDQAYMEIYQVICVFIKIIVLHLTEQ